MMNGNFSMAPLGLRQLYVIRAQLANTAASDVFSPYCRTNLKISTKFCCKWLLTTTMRLGCIQTQQQQSVLILNWQAINCVLGPHTVTQDWFYHLTQSTWRKIQNLGLTSLQRKLRLQIILRRDWLSFLPIGDAPTGMELFRGKCPEQAVPC